MGRMKKFALLIDFCSFSWIAIQHFGTKTNCYFRHISSLNDRKLFPAYITSIIIHEIFRLHAIGLNTSCRDYNVSNIFVCVTWPNIPQQLGNIQYSSIFKTARLAKTSWRIINTMASILGENMLGYLSLDIICSS